ncbi:hypothetical protein V494_02716 [Pseudogymnoascus sp. VKM F-4513 (FW-928)]|nr:hypothetical protein V494_02716 [Pseudogymnoascus sp. VKM F-4513 (FW-928)]
MARQRRQKDVSSSDIPLAHPDKSGPDPSRQTLLNLAAERGLLDAEIQDRKAGKLPTGAVPLRAKPDEEPLIGRFGEAVLWSSSLAMLHFSLDVLTQHQYSEVLSWQRVITQSLQAFGVILVLFYALHPHSAPAAVFPRIPALLHQLIFFASSVGGGCYLIHITNEYSYYAVLKQAPPLGVIWIWSVIELDLLWALGSLLSCLAFLWLGGYSVM